MTYINSNGTLAESIGYIATGTETVYICVYSVLGGSITDAFTLDYAITTNFTKQIGSGNGGEITLPSGRYYIRVVSTNTSNDFDASNLCTYNLSVVPVSRVDEIRITEIVSNHGNIVTEYPQGTKYRVDGEQTNYVAVKGIAYYIDEQGIRHESANANISGTIEDLQWSKINRPDMAFVNCSAITNDSGSYRLEFYLHSGVGGLRYTAQNSVHCYDLMKIIVNPTDNANINQEKDFYYLVRCIR